MKTEDNGYKTYNTLEDDLDLLSVPHAILLNSTNEPLKNSEGETIYFPHHTLLELVRAMFGTTRKENVLMRCSFISQ